MARDGVIVNRVHLHGLDGQPAEAVEALLAGELGDSLARRVAHNLADFDVLVRRDRDTIARLRSELDEPNPVIVPHLDEDIQDLAGSRGSPASLRLTALRAASGRPAVSGLGLD